MHFVESFSIDRWSGGRAKLERSDSWVCGAQHTRELPMRPSCPSEDISDVALHCWGGSCWPVGNSDPPVEEVWRGRPLRGSNKCAASQERGDRQGNGNRRVSCHVLQVQNARPPSPSGPNRRIGRSVDGTVRTGAGVLRCRIAGGPQMRYRDRVGTSRPRSRRAVHQERCCRSAQRHI